MAWETLNFDATHIKELIDWELETITEPPLTYKLSTQDLIEVEAVKLKIKCGTCSEISHSSKG